MRFCSLILLFILVGCTPKANREGDRLLFQIEKKENFIKISTFNKSNQLLSNVDFYKVPQRIVIFSSSHAGFINELGLIDKVIAVSNKNYFYNSKISENENIATIGDYQSVNFEKLAKLNPDLVLLNSEVITHKDFINKLKTFNIPYLICNEYEESHVLKQAQWIQLYGAIFNEEKKADTIFNEIHTHYTQLINKTKSNNKNITLTGLPWQNQWYISCAKSLFNQLLKDAGGTLFIEKDCAENSAIHYEDILKYGRNANFWIHTGTASTYREIEDHFPLAKEIKAFKEKKCFNNNLKIAPNQANDFWERGPVRPDLILEDIIRIYTDTRFSKGNFYKRIIE